MASPWEDTDIPDTADPTDPSVDDDESNTTQPFTPGASEGPYHGGEAHEMAQFPQEQSGQDTDPLLTGDELDQRLQQTRQGSAWADLLEMYPQANKEALEVGYQKDKQGNPRLVVKMVGRGKKEYPLFTKNAVTRQLRENPNLSQEIKTYLGKSMGEQMKDFQQAKARKIAEANTALRDTQRRLDEAQQTEVRLNTEEQKQEQEAQKRHRLETQLEQINQRLENKVNEGGTEMERQMETDRLKRERAKLKRDIDAAKKREKGYAQTAKEQGKVAKEVERLKRQYENQRQKRDTAEATLNRTKPLDELEREREELKRKIEEDRRIMNDKDATPQQRMVAGERFSENTDELARLDPQVQEREEALPLRERVKNIFKKYGWTLQAVALAVGIVLSALALAATNGLKAGTKAIGNGLKAIGQKLGSLLPGLIGSIVSYIFKAAGSVLSFLGEHAWLLILAVVAFFMERLLKRRRK